MLRIEIKRIEITRDFAWSRHFPRFGCLTCESALGELLLNEPVPDLSYHWQLDRSAGTGTLRLLRSQLQEVQIPLHPFLGSIGVAPRYGRVEPALVPGEFGGNMDCAETCEGAVLYLPVWVRGAYLSFGDVHAAQGDGEICGVALETTANVTLRIGLLKHRLADWPRVENASHLMVIGSARPLIDAVRIAHLDLLKWLVSDYGFDKWEALQLLSQVGIMRVGNVVDPNYSVVAKFPKAYLP